MLRLIIGCFILLGYFIKEQKDSIDNRLDAIERRLIRLSDDGETTE